jgi:hypothetical protein
MKLVMNFSKKKKKIGIHTGRSIRSIVCGGSNASGGRMHDKGDPSEELIGASRSDSSKVGDGIRRS